MGSNPTRLLVLEKNVPLNLERIIRVARRKFYNSVLKIKLCMQCNSFNFKQTYDKKEQCKPRLEVSLGTLPNYKEN